MRSSTRPHLRPSSSQAGPSARGRGGAITVEMELSTAFRKSDGPPTPKTPPEGNSTTSLFRRLPFHEHFQNLPLITNRLPPLIRRNLLDAMLSASSKDGLSV